MEKPRREPMSKASQALRLAFANAVKPPDRLPIADWAKKHVRTARSGRSDYADLTQTPWLIEPIEKMIGDDASRVVLLAPTGGGKSTAMSIAATYIVAEKPCRLQLAMLSDPDAQQFMELDLMPALRNCKLIDGFWPQIKNKIRKDFIDFVHMPLWCEGSNKSNFTGKTVITQFLDEAWDMDQGLLAEALARLQNQFGAKSCLLSQAGWKDDDLDKQWNACYQFEYAYKCPSCNQLHPYDFKQLKWTKEEIDSKTIWQSVEAWYECPCGHKFQDNQKERREMAESGSYIEGDSPNPEMNHYGYHFSALNVWWESWQDLAIKFLKSLDALKQGNVNFLREFNQKRLARSWDATEHLEDKPVSLSDYKIADCPRYDVTILTADVQKVDIWWQVRTWGRSGESKLINFGKVISFSDLAKKVEEYSIPNNCVFVDSAYRLSEVKDFIATHKFLGLNGRPQPDFPIKDKRTGKTLRRLFDAPKPYPTGSGIAYITYYSSMGVKDILFRLKSNKSDSRIWEVPVDICEDYKLQINAEVPVIGKDGKPAYDKRGRNNHATDTECMSLVAAMMHKCYKTTGVEE